MLRLPRMRELWKGDRLRYSWHVLPMTDAAGIPALVEAIRHK